MTTIDIELTRKEIQELLSIFSSEEYQEREWKKNKEKTVVFPTELFSQWFDDVFNYPEDPKYLIKQKILTESEWVTIEPFHRMLYEFTEIYEKDGIDNIGKPSILEYEPWLQVRKKARETLAKLGWDQ